MVPTINFHNISSLRLTSIQHYPAEIGRAPFATRMLIFTDRQGETFRLGLFAEEEAHLRTEDERIAAKGLRDCNAYLDCCERQGATLLESALPAPF